MADLYQFDPENYEDLKKKTISDIVASNPDNEILGQELKHFLKSIIDLISGTQQDSLKSRGYVITVSGTWGAGKTSATWALVNEVKAKVVSDSKEDNPLLIIEKSMLPFGGASESIATFLGEFAEKLWENSFIDVRSEIKRFMLEVTPDVEAKYNVSANIGPLSLSRPIHSAVNSFNADKLLEKFTRLASSGKSVLIIIDDLDRLRPSEIVDVMRMVEKLRALPSVIVMLPIYKSVITDAFEHNLELPASSAATFLRKLTDAELFIDNGLKDLKNLFIKSFHDDETNKSFDTILAEYGTHTGEMCWLILVHILTLEEALATINSGDGDMQTVVDATNRQASEYLADLRDLLAESRNNETGAPYPVHFHSSSDVFRPIGDHYDAITSNSNATDMIRTYTGLLNYDDINRQVTLDPTIAGAVSRHEVVTFDLQKQIETGKPMLVEVLLPLLRGTEKETYLTNNYKLRDMKILARMIQGDPDFKLTSDPIRQVYSVVHKNFRRFRF